MENNCRNTPSSDWSNCTKCRLHATRNNVVVRGQWIINTIHSPPRLPKHPHIHPINPLSPGNEKAAWHYLEDPLSYSANFLPYVLNLHFLPPHILIIGEAPGESEDFHGVPFYGVAGHIFRTVLDYSRTRFLATITNTVCCRPTRTDELTNRLVNRQPETSEQFLCLSHTQELIEAYEFHGVILLGEVANEYNKQFIKTHLPTLQLFHPAYIARLNYKLRTIREEARKIQLWVKSLKTGKPYSATS